MSKQNNKSKYATIPVDPETKQKLFVMMAKAGYSEWITFMKRITYILSKFKPELKEEN